MVQNCSEEALTEIPTDNNDTNLSASVCPKDFLIDLDINNVNGRTDGWLLVVIGACVMFGKIFCRIRCGCMYLCMNVFIYVCMYLYMYVSMYV